MFDEFEADRKEKGPEMAELKDDLKSLKEYLSKADKTSGCREQYSKRKYFLFRAVFFGEQVTIQDTNRSHRLGKRKHDHPKAHYYQVL